MPACPSRPRTRAARAGSDARFVRRVLWVLALIGLAWLLVALADLLLLLIFGAVVVAVIERLLSAARDWSPSGPA